MTRIVCRLAVSRPHSLPPRNQLLKALNGSDRRSAPWHRERVESVGCALPRAAARTRLRNLRGMQTDPPRRLSRRLDTTRRSRRPGDPREVVVLGVREDRCARHGCAARRMRDRGASSIYSQQSHSAANVRLAPVMAVVGAPGLGNPDQVARANPRRRRRGRRLGQRGSRIDFENHDDLTPSGKITVAKRFDPLPLGLAASFEESFDSSKKRYQVNCHRYVCFG